MLINELLTLFRQEIGTVQKGNCSISSPELIEKSDTTVRTSNDYASDVAVLSVFFPLAEGGKIEVSLQDLLSIIPRRRPRVDAYNGLVSYVKNRYGVELIIKSRKSK